MEHDDADPLGARRHTLITGARGQLGHALVDAFQGDDVRLLEAVGERQLDIPVRPGQRDDAVVRELPDERPAELAARTGD